MWLVEKGCTDTVQFEWNKHRIENNATDIVPNSLNGISIELKIMQQVLFLKLNCVVQPLRSGVAETLEVSKENCNLRRNYLQRQNWRHCLQV